MSTDATRMHHLFGLKPWREAACDQDPSCNGTGWRQVEGRYGHCRCQFGGMVRSQGSFGSSGIPEVHAKLQPFEISTDRLGDIVGTVERWVEGFRPGRSKGLILLGAPGTGKTRLAGAAAVKLLMVLAEPFRPSCAVQWLSWPLLLRRLRATYRRDADETEHDVIEEILSAKVLVIDDVGAEPRNDSDWAQGILCQVLDGALGATSPALIITTNLLPGDLEQRYSTRVFRRIREAAGEPDGAIIPFSDIEDYTFRIARMA